MDLDQAVQKHAEWKVKFRTAISKREKLDAASIAKDNACDVGKWLHGDAKSQYAGFNSLKECLAKHAAFHAEAGKVALAINAKKYSEAETMLAAGTPFAAASNAVGVAIIQLKKEIGQLVSR
jgi:methyl-accepting chemotaxis protein